MKFFAMTAALALSTAAFAQTSPTTSGNTPPSGADAPMTSQQMPADPSMRPGGYMPAQPPMSGPAQAGATIRVQPSMPASQAFPPPAPKAEYPVCKRGQTDGCRNRGE
ncbi:hypothetical protein [Sphingomonas sp. 37zxx]|uniref:hypothetical protein n=1 Tax=Sphingomonas sp. 37zxx TaxID=1550073 RepID=UPI000691E0CF|nr:hypothetical protein [Sphingomonas sp. 37zxx]